MFYSVHSNPQIKNRNCWTKLALALIVILSYQPLYAAGLKFASPFADHMVLQRDQPIHIWGQADPGSEVEVSLDTQKAKAAVNQTGQWEVTFKPLPAGGPFPLSASSAGQSLTFQDVLVGDVWFCSGQSNMQMPLKECDDAAAVAKLADHYPKLRLCTVGKGWNAKPQTSTDVKWRTSTPDNAQNFSAVGFYFASELLKDPAVAEVPIAVIDSSFGGTTCEGWISNSSLATFNAKDLHDSMFGIKPGMLYNAMIAPFGELSLKGVIWYQGEGNASQPATYEKFLTTMIGDWRKQFASPDLPFFIIQLPDFVQESKGLQWSWIREAQAKAVAKTPHTALALAINTNDGFDLHPKQKHEIGRRVALLARRDAYGEKLIASGPIFKDAKVEGAAIRVNFDTAGDGLASSAETIHGLAVAGEDGEYRYATATIEGDSVIVKSELVKEPKTVRYAWAGVPASTLTNKSGLPAAPFRTDTLPPAEIELQKQPVYRHLATANYELTLNGSGQITSLGIGGRQFLSNGLGTSGGTSIPGFLGPRSLANIRELGPDLISCSDGQITLLLSFKPDTMEWTVTNRGKDPVNFRIVLAPQVALSEFKAGQPLTLTRGKATLVIDGIESLPKSDDGKVLELTIKGGTDKHLKLQVEAH